ncbi:MAG: hypothetical protein ACYS32_03615 [Planctomycetota bacterium]|jgi:hypothetical protein
MNRQKTKEQIKKLKKELKAANRASHVRLFKLALVLAIVLTAAAFIYPSPIRGKLRHWVRNTFNMSFSQ